MGGEGRLVAGAEEGERGIAGGGQGMLVLIVNESYS